LTIPGSFGCNPGARSFWAKSIGLSISDFELHISDFWTVVFQSAFRNLQSAIPIARPVHEKEAALIFAHKLLAPGPGLFHDGAEGGTPGEIADGKKRLSIFSVFSIYETRNVQIL